MEHKARPFVPISFMRRKTAMSLGERFEWALVFATTKEESDGLATALSKLVTGTKALFEGNGLAVQHAQLREAEKGGKTSCRHVLLLTTSSAEMDALAERLEVQKLKPDATSGEKMNEIFLRADAASFDGYGKPGFYTPSEREHFVRVLVEGVLSTDARAKELLSTSGVVHFYKEFGNLKNVEDDSLIGLLLRAGVLEGAAPLHRGELQSIFNKLITVSPFK